MRGYYERPRTSYTYTPMIGEPGDYLASAPPPQPVEVRPDPVEVAKAENAARIKLANTQPTQIYVWNGDWRTDYSSGVVAVVATSIEQARELALKQLGEYDRGDVSGEPMVFPTHVPGVVVDEYGGA